MRRSLSRVLPLVVLSVLLPGLWPASAWAGSRWLQNDSYNDDGELGFQGGFVLGECWGSVYEPEEGDYPFTLEKVRLLVGGSSQQYIFSVSFYTLAGTDLGDANLLGSEGVALTGSDETWQELNVPELELYLPAIESGNLGIGVCFEEHSGYPGPARDTDGVNGALNYIRADIGSGADWYSSSVLGVQGDWVMRACIEGSGVSDQGCTEGDSDVDGDTDSDTDGDTDSDTDSDALGLFAISPNTAKEGEAVSVILAGSGFVDGVEARIGGISLVGVQVLSSTQISGRTPSALPPGTHDVEVVIGGENAYLPAAFTVDGGCGCDTGGGAGLGILIGLGWLGVRRKGG